MRRTRLALAVLVALLAPVAPLGAQPSAPLANLRFDLVGARLVVDPPSLTVPKDIPTAISTALALPAGLDVANAEALRTLAASAEVVAELRGPSLPTQQIRVRAGEPIPIPPLPLAGEFWLDRIRLEKDGATLLDGTPSSVPIQVIDEILVTSVTTRPLSLDELQERGVLIDETNFSAYAFELTLDVDGTPLRIDLPVVYPRFDLDGLNQKPPREIIDFALDINRELAALARIELPPDIERPGLDISILAVPFFPAEDAAGSTPFGAPPLVGLVVIPGQVAFLNGFFSALVQVQNVAPGDSRLSVRDVAATITLPPGADRVAGTPEAPGDDPLRLARFDGGVVRDRVAVLGVGLDAAPGTADDDVRLEPGESGQGEFVIEGRTEGSHAFDVELEAVLEGLPTGPVEMRGTAAGAVLVRNPTFAVAFSHPRTVRASEPYDLFVTVTNTSAEIANRVRVQLDERSVSGTRLDSDDSVSFETLEPYESGTARFRLIAQQTGTVTATYLRTATGLEGGLSLRTGVDERDVPLQPDQIALPRDTSALPEDLVIAAQRVLGQTLGVARAPAGTLPPDVLPIRYSTLTERGRALGLAGQRIVFGDTLLRSVADLVLDWSDAPPDTGFDQLLRETDAGAAFLAAAGDALALDLHATALDRFDAIADALAPRAPPPLLFATSRAGPPVALLPDDPASLHVPLPDAELAIAAGPGVRLLGVRLLVGTGDGESRVDVGVALPLDPAGVVVLRFEDVLLFAGGAARLEGDTATPASLRLVVDRDGDGRSDESVVPSRFEIPDRAPDVIAARQLDTSSPGWASTIRDPAYHGLLFAVLFDEPVDAATIDELTRWSVEANGVRDVALQPGGRLVRVLLERGIGTWIPRKVAIEGATDLRGNATARIERSIDAILSDGGELTGQVQSADGMPVGGGRLILTVVEGLAGFTPSSILTDASGLFAFDFVRRTRTGYVLLAQHPTTGETATARGAIRGAGDSVYTRVLFQARGSVRGSVLGIDGAPVEGAQIILRQSFGEVWYALSDAAGEWALADVPIGGVTVRAIATSGEQGFSEGFLDAPGDEAVVDVVLTTVPSATGDVAGRVFDSDGSTAVAGAAVYLGSYDRQSDTMVVLAQTTSDDAGAFHFEAIPADTGHDVVALEAGSGRFGVSHVGLVRVATTTAVNVVFEATGTVTGTVRDAFGDPAPGALVSGGTAIATTDAAGRFSTSGVPAGQRTIEAANPVTKRRGASAVTVPPGGTAEIEILLEARASIVGVVRNAAGDPVPNVTVRLPRSGGFFFVFANEEGRFLFPDMPVDDYRVQAPGPPRESLITWMEENGIPLEAAFTLGVPAELGGSGPPPITDERTALRAYATAVTALFSATDRRLASLPDPPAGGFGWSRATLVNDQQIEDASVRYLPMGSVAGTTVDEDGNPIAAAVRMMATVPGATGNPIVRELVRVQTEPLVGTFAFDDLVARFDLETFQRAGVRTGDFTVEGFESFTRGFVRETGRLDTANPDNLDLVLQFGGDDLVNSISGTVFLPDGETPAPADSEVFVPVDATGVTVRTDADGHYRVEAPIRAGVYSLVATEPASGLQGERTVALEAGEDAIADIRLLGLGAVDVRVLRPDGSVVANAHVAVDRSTFPGDRAEGDSAGDGHVRLTGLTEGYFAVVAEDLATGLRGRANGEILRDGVVGVDVVVQAAGTVTGRLVAPDGVTPVADAQVQLSVGAVNIFARSDSDGRFTLEAVPVGSFSIDTEDPKSGRRGVASGEMRFQNERVDVLVRQTGLGVVEGRVVTANGDAVVGADVSIAASQGGVSTWRTSAADGSFRFGAVGEGPFTLRAVDRVSHFDGSARGEIRFEGETVRQDIALAAFGAIEAQVQDADGAPVGNAEVTLIPQAGVFGGTSPAPSAVDPDGRVRFEFLALGAWFVEARSLADPNSRGRVVALVEAGGTEAAIVTLRGTGSVDVTVLDASGAPAPGARVVLNARGHLDDEPRLPFGVEMIAGAEGDGVAHFTGVPFGAFDVRAERGTVAGVANGAIETPGAAEIVVVELGPAGSVVGRAILPDGSTPAFETIATLRFTPRTALHSGVLQVRTDLDGRFEFGGIPLGTFTVDLFEPVSLGLAHRDASFDASGPTGQQIDLGELVLDATSPRVLASEPADGASAVVQDTAITLVFSEPMLRTSVRTSPGGENVSVRIGATRVDGSVEFEDGDRRVVFRPSDPLPSSALVTVSVDGAPEGPRDLVQLPTPDPFVASFQVEDVIPPQVADASPPADAIGVRLDAVLRVAFDEAMDPDLAIAVEDGSGAAVAGDTALALGGTVAIFTPRAFLDANETYRARFDAVRDRAGNAIETGFDGQPLGGAPLELAFETLDTIPPRFEALALGGAPSRKEGSTVTVVPALPDADAVQVVYRVAGSAPLVVDVAPFALALVLPRDVAQLDVAAEAIDAAGNHSGAQLLGIAIESDLAPDVALIPLTPEGDVAAGSSVSVRLVASDDVGLASVAASATGAFTANQLRAPGGAVGFEEVMSFAVPANAATGASFEIGAAASDLGAATSSAPPLHYAVRDGTGPAVAIPAPVAGAQVVPGETIDVVVTAQDPGGVRSLTLACTPSAAGCEARNLAAAPSATTERFAVVVPPGLVAPNAFTLIASAVDAAGNPSPSSAASVRALRAADATAPVVVELSAPGGDVVAPGQVATLRVRATDAVGVRGVRLLATGATPSPQERAITPALLDATAEFSITVPADAADGATIELLATARDAALESAPRALALRVQRDETPPLITVLEPAPDSVVRPGTSLVVRVHAEDERGVARVQVEASGAFEASGASDSAPPLPSFEPTLVLGVPGDAAPGAVSLRAVAIDAAGNQSEITVPLRVQDTGAPQVSIVAPADGVEIDPRNSLPVELEASDAGGLAGLRLQAFGAAALDESRPVTGNDAAETFTVSFGAAPPEGGTLTLSASATDADGNVATDVRTLAVRDVVPPAVVATTPLAGASDVPLETVLEVVFSESMDADSLAAALRLETADGTPVAAVFSLGNGRNARLTPAALLAPAADHVLRVDASASDLHGLTLAAPLAVAFRTAQPDGEPPRVLSTYPEDGATDVSLSVYVQIQLSEPIDCTSLDEDSFRLVVAGTPVDGDRDCFTDHPYIYFNPAVPLPLESDVEIQLSAAVRDRAGLALVAPFVSRFSTGSFSLVRPREGEVWTEGETVRLLARRSATLPAGSVRFEVDGVEIAGVGTTDAEAFFRVPPAAEHTTIHVAAVALRSDGIEIARDAVDVAVGIGLAVEPHLVGVPLGGSARVRLRLSSAAAADLAVTLVPIAAGVVGAPPAPVVIRAGERETSAVLNGLAIGATGLRAESSLATGTAVASVSSPVSGRLLQVLGAEVGAQVRAAASAGTVALEAGATHPIEVPFLAAPAASGLAVAVTSSDASIATAPGGAAVAAGSQQLRLTVVAGVPGVATLRLAGGGLVRTLTVIVGPPPPGLLPLALAPLVGAQVRHAPSLGTAVLAEGTTQTLSVVLLDLPSATPPPLVVATSDASVATIEGTPQIQPGSRIAVFTVRTGGAGRAELTLRAGDVVRSYGIVSGAPPEGSVPLVVAPLVGARVPHAHGLGTVYVPVGGALFVPARLFAVLTPVPIPVAVTSDRSDVATVAGAPVVPAGSDTALLDVRGVAAGRAVLELRAGMEARRLVVVVGDPSDPGATLAPPVGVEVGPPAP